MPQRAIIQKSFNNIFSQTKCLRLYIMKLKYLKFEVSRDFNGSKPKKVE